MWDKLLFLTLITVFFPWSLLVLLLLFGWDETVRIFRNVVLDTFGPTVIAVVSVLMFVIGLLFVALAIFWAYKDIESFLVAIVVVGILIGFKFWVRSRATADASIVAREVFPVWAAQGPFDSGTSSATAMQYAYVAVRGPEETERMAEAIKNTLTRLMLPLILGSDCVRTT